MAVRSRRLWGPTNMGTNATVTLYSVPAGRTAVIRTITVANGSATTAGTIRFGINSSSSTARILEGQAVPLGDTFIWDHWLALDPGDDLIGVSVGVSLRCTGFGALLLGEPS